MNTIYSYEIIPKVLMYALKVAIGLKIVKYMCIIENIQLYTLDRNLGTSEINMCTWHAKMELRHLNPLSCQFCRFRDLCIIIYVTL